MQTQNLSALKIHKLSQEQYEREVANGTLDETALYITPDTKYLDMEQTTEVGVTEVPEGEVGQVLGVTSNGVEFTTLSTSDLENDAGYLDASHNTSSSAHADIRSMITDAGYLDASHNTSSTAHADIRALISNPTSVLVTLSSSGWSNLTQTVTVNGISADESAQLIMPVPQIASSSAYNSAGIRLTAQAANSLTFTASSAPSTNINVYIVYQELN